MMDWEYIESVLKVSAELKADRKIEILDSLKRLDDYFGKKWIENAFFSSPGNYGIEVLVDFERCLRITDKITNGRKLKEKLMIAINPGAFYIPVQVTDIDGKKQRQTDSGHYNIQNALAEAHVAARLIESGAIVEYEPPLTDESGKPDFVSTWNDKHIAFEVTRLQISAEDAEQWHNRQYEIADKCGEFLMCGSLDIYLTEPKISKETINLIIESVQEIATSLPKTKCIERFISDTIYCFYDPSGSVRQDRTNPPKIGEKNGKPNYGVCIHDVKADRSIEIEKKLKVRFPMPAAARVYVQTKNDGSNTLSVVRVYRVANDTRVISKIENKTRQLPSNMPGVVVIDMGGSTARLHDWASEISRSFDFNLYSEVSAIWQRKGTLTATGLKWYESIVLNPIAKHVFYGDILFSLMPKTANICTAFQSST